MAGNRPGEPFVFSPPPGGLGIYRRATDAPGRNAPGLGFGAYGGALPAICWGPLAAPGTGAHVDQAVSLERTGPPPEADDRTSPCAGVGVSRDAPKWRRKSRRVAWEGGYLRRETRGAQRVRRALGTGKGACRRVGVRRGSSAMSLPVLATRRRREASCPPRRGHSDSFVAGFRVTQWHWLLAPPEQGSGTWQRPTRAGREHFLPPVPGNDGRVVSCYLVVASHPQNTRPRRPGTAGVAGSSPPRPVQRSPPPSSWPRERRSVQ